MSDFEKFWSQNKPKTCDLVDTHELQNLIEFAYQAGRELGFDEGLESANKARMEADHE